MNKIVLILTGIVLLGIAGFATLWFGVGGELQELAEDVLVDWREGRLERIYEGAADPYKGGRTLAQHRAYLDHWSSRLGSFVEVIGRTDLSDQPGSDSSRKTVLLDLAFEKGRGQGRFEFIAVDEELKLAHLSLHDVRPPVEKEDRSALQAEARRLLRQYDEQAIVELFAALSSGPQKAWPPEQMRQELEYLHERVGRITKVELRSEEQPADDQHVQRYDLTFERGHGTAGVAWTWAEQRWLIAGFSINGKP